LRSGARIA